MALTLPSFCSCSLRVVLCPFQMFLLSMFNVRVLLIFFTACSNTPRMSATFSEGRVNFLLFPSGFVLYDENLEHVHRGYCKGLKSEMETDCSTHHPRLRS